MDKKSLLIVISGPSAVGKGTICKELLKRNPQIKMSISATTRKPRLGEEEGLNYFFMSKERFRDMIVEDKFLEHATVFDNYYGTPKEYVMDNLKNGNDVLLEIDTDGALQIKNKFPDALFIFILPPSLEELKRRIESRGTESEAEIEKRYKAAVLEIKQVVNYEYVVINNTIEEAVEDIEDIIKVDKFKVLRNSKEILLKFD